MLLVLSIVVPTLNEASHIAETLGRLVSLRKRGAEVILVDGGSTDGTLDIAVAMADHVMVSAAGRATQMNVGAVAARGNTLLFLHADTSLPDDVDSLIEAALERGHLWGRFDVSIRGQHPMLGVVARMMNLRSRLSGIATGDQAMFIQTEIFMAVGGFPRLALMEDVALSKKLRAISPPACIAERVNTSGRRWERHGVCRTILLMWWLRLRYFLGADPDRLARQYRREPD